VITLSFDDGFKKSSIRTAEIFEKHKLQACINVIATGHLQINNLPDSFHTGEKGDFVLWNELKSRGHEIMPHGYKHANKAEIPLAEAQDLVRKCLDYFTENLRGFRQELAVFNLPYNASTPELEEWLKGLNILAYRKGYEAMNPLPHKGQKTLTCNSFGPGSAEDELDNQVKRLLALPEGWLIFNLHGLDGEGWGPVRSDYLDRLLDRLLEIDTVSVIPAGMALEEVQ
jgi:peptidoglycan/xylan/chitin deacetylase (PgdA/CDA1 family)